jgi:hypothetical protein
LKVVKSRLVLSNFWHAFTLNHEIDALNFLLHEKKTPARYRAGEKKEKNNAFIVQPLT